MSSDMSSPKKIKPGRFTSTLLQLAIIVGSILAALCLLNSGPVPPWALVVGVIIGAFTIQPHGAEKNGRPLVSAIISQGVAALIICVLWRWLFSLSAKTFFLIPIWTSASVCVFAVQTLISSKSSTEESRPHFTHVAVVHGLNVLGIVWLRVRPAGVAISASAAFILYLGSIYVPGSLSFRSISVFAEISWILFCIFFNHRHWTETFSVTIKAALGLIIVGCAYKHAHGALALPFFIWAFWSALLSTLFITFIKLQGSIPQRAEAFRIVLIAFGALWFLRGFAVTTLHGTNDALWYATMLADMVAQTRAGVFPVWAGQSLYQFNGAIYPLRVAPAFHYLGALLDGLTFHALPTFSLQNFLITIVGVTGAIACYVSLCTILPSKRWAAAFLALIFLGCPGVLAVAYHTDLYMTWTTVPWVPVAIASALGFFHERSFKSSLPLATAVGLCWWGHSPIAIWTTIIAGVFVVLSLFKNVPGRKFPKSLFVSATILGGIAAYPIGSVLFYPPETGINAAGFQEARPDLVGGFLRQAFPSNIFPVSTWGRELGDFQLGYGLWIIAAVSIVLAFRSASSASRYTAGVITVLILLLMPIPTLNVRLWALVPKIVRDTTGNWAMNRLYLILATVVVCSAALWIKTLGSRGYGVALILFSILIAWSGIEGAKFVFGSNALKRSEESASTQLLPENVMITQFAYLVFPKRPPNFSHGVVAPELLNRVLSPSRDVTLVDNERAAKQLSTEVQMADFIRAENNRPWLELSSSFSLAAHQSYLMTFDFAEGAAEKEGVLQIIGSRLSREYGLPEYGGKESFGVGGTHAPEFPIWNSSDATEKLKIRFIPNSAPTAPVSLSYARVHLRSYDPNRLPVRMAGWIPYRATVTTDGKGWLETPRMYQRGYRARVNGAPALVEKTIAGLVGISVPAGTSEVELRYDPPVGLAALFWISAAAHAAAGITMAKVFLNSTALNRLRAT